MRPVGTELTLGVAWALGAGLCWGGAFLAPLILIGYSALEITAGRFAGSGLFSLLVLGFGFLTGRNGGLGRPRLWLLAFGLALLGNFIYFACVTAGVQRANAAIVTLIIGTLPIAIPLVAQLADGTFRLSKTWLPAGLIVAGLIAVHYGAHTPSQSDAFDLRYLSGLAFAGIGLVSWTAFAILNARVMSENQHVSAVSWSSLQGVALLPVSLLLLLPLASDVGIDPSRAAPSTFLAVSFGLGVVTSWMAILCWNRASQLLPQSLAGQLLVFETIASLGYVYLWYRAWPPWLVVGGAALLIAGVLSGIRRLRTT
jgi:drug/metabolite transporter (DMT)-like permease